MTSTTSRFNDACSSCYDPQLKQRQRLDRLFEITSLIGSSVGLVLLVILTASVFIQGFDRLSGLLYYFLRIPYPPDLLPNFRFSVLGTVWIPSIALLFALPVGIATAIFLEEYPQDNCFKHAVDWNITILADVPSILYGCLGLHLFVHYLKPLTQGPTVLSATLTMALLILPKLIDALRRAIRTVPQSLRAAFAKMLAGVMFTVARMIGEAAPLLLVGGLVYLIRDPDWFNRFMVLPVQIYFLISQSENEFQKWVATFSIVLLVPILLLNVVASYLHDHFGQEYWRRADIST